MEGKHHSRVVRLDDYDVILVLEILKTAKIVVFPHLKGLYIFYENTPGFVPCTTDEEKGKASRKKRKSASLVIYVAIIAAGLKHGDDAFLVVHVEQSVDFSQF